ncbi:type VI secretion system-associated protein TagF [Caballeronia sp. AZ10_KS36]|uniref:type VI secretion system-associated protein TagF n=1 Tax=Caballeronia sp. AZ10_KS36 TaxID=2921757 RepID=UPI00202971EB|nr:type VI secretion system-associated protein TagF [Caballeronia sp. AZ10_KS36]
MPGFVMSAGFYGKVRTHGDFVGRGLPDSFVKTCDAWLQRGLLTARQRAPHEWLESYLAMPVWRFCASPGIFDERAYAGALMPGIDAVGRYFPLIVAREIHGASCAVDSPWHESAAALALSTLAPSFSMRAFEARLAALPAPPFRETTCHGGSAWWTQAGEKAHRHTGALDSGLFLRLLGD